jgi:serine/threonine-protein kinase
VPFSGANPFLIMNERLLKNPEPPREIEATITPQLQEIVYRALERDPTNRYPNARDFAWDLNHQDQVGVSERAAPQDSKNRRTSWPKPKKILLYVGLGLIPVVIFGLLLWVAKHS